MNLIVFIISSFLFLALVGLLVESSSAIRLLGYSLPAWSLLLTSGIFSGISVWAWEKRNQRGLTKQEHHNTKRREAAEITAENASEKIKVLEAKIQTLETALSKALNQVSKTSV